MGREIKFRIWDKINRMWLRCFNVNLFDIGDLPNVELMQYTGLKDKNGKEIYEGDIVILNDTEEENRCIVKYKYGSYILVDGDLRENLSNVEAKFLEVIGNLFFSFSASVLFLFIPLLLITMQIYTEFCI